MIYINTKTGATIDSPFEIKGDNWELVKPKKEVKTKPVTKSKKKE